jgi:hypothetical protein
LAASRVIEPVGPTVAALGAWLGVAYGPPGPVIAEDVLPGTTVVVVDGLVVFAAGPPVESELVAAKPAVAVPMTRALAKLKICNFFMGNFSSLHTQSGAERLTTRSDAWHHANGNPLMLPPADATALQFRQHRWPKILKRYVAQRD